MLVGGLATGEGQVHVLQHLGTFRAPLTLFSLEKQQDLPLGVAAYSLDVAVAGADEAGVDVCPTRCFSASAAR